MEADEKWIHSLICGEAASTLLLPFPSPTLAQTYTKANPNAPTSPRPVYSQSVNQSPKDLDGFTGS